MYLSNYWSLRMNTPIHDANMMLADLYRNEDGEPLYTIIKYHSKVRLMYLDPNKGEETVYHIFSNRLEDSEAVDLVLAYVIKHQYILKNPV